MKILSLALMLLLCADDLWSQDSDTARDWSNTIELNAFIMAEDFSLIPIYMLDHRNMHFRLRYNYEELGVVSAWAGYRWHGGRSFQYAIVPVVGAMMGSAPGWAVGYELDLGWRSFSLDSDSEFVFFSEPEDEDYFYSWTDISYQALDWLSAGISLQRTKLTRTPTDLEMGILVGGGFDDLWFTGYLYNPWDAGLLFVYLSLDYSF